MEADHKTKVDDIAATVRQFHDSQQPFRIYHGSTNSTRRVQYQRDKVVDTSGLTNIWAIDTEKKTVRTEPNVPMDKLVESTLDHGLVPLVVMEFPGITVGGGFSGTSGESSSFRHGVFHRTVNWIEIVLADGECTTASPSDKDDLFWGAASSLGSLGIVTMLEIRLMEAQPYVELTYHPESSLELAVKKTEEITADPSNDYLDGIVFARDKVIICSGRFVGVLPKGIEVQRFTRAQDQWFYRHVEKIAASNDFPRVDYIPLVDYLFRYDRGAFWTGKYAFRYFLTPFNRITRYLLDNFMHTRVMYHALHESGLADQYIVQDVSVPYAALTDFFEWLHGNFSYYPLWLCPLKQNGYNNPVTSGLLADKPDEPDYYMNVGIWGPGSTNRQIFIEQNRQLEHKVHLVSGQKCLYAQTYYTEDEFWASYNRKEYDALRSKYRAWNLPSVYDKVRATERPMPFRIWPLSGLYGVYKVWRGGDYLIQNRRAQTGP